MTTDERLEQIDSAIASFEAQHDVNGELTEIIALYRTMRFIVELQIKTMEKLDEIIANRN